MKDNNELINLIYKAALDNASWYPLLSLMSNQLSEDMKKLAANPDHKDTFFTLVHHFQSALKLSEQKLLLQHEKNTLTTILNQLPIAVIIVQPDGFIVRKNKSAELMLSNKQQPLQFDQHGYLMLTNNKKQAQTLKKLIAQVASSPDNSIETFSLANSNITLAHAAPISKNIDAKKCLVSLFITVPKLQDPIELSWIQSQYAIIPSEARLIHALITHSTDLGEVAVWLNLSKETVRSYLKNIFSKRNVHSQPELINKILSEAPLNHLKQNTEENLHFMCLKDGRRLAFNEYGDPSGYPVFNFHPFSGSRLLVHPNDSIAKKLGVRLISVDRPGFGKSSPLLNRNFLDVAYDIEHLANYLGIKHFSLLSYAGGCPYALAAAHIMKNRIDKLALVSCMPPLKTFRDTQGMHTLNRMTIRIAQKTPSLARRCIRLMLLAMNNKPQQYFSNVTPELSLADRKIISRSEIMSTYISAAQEAMTQGGSAIANEIIDFVHDWNFDYTDITAETSLWHGVKDRHIPIRLSKRMAEALPNCTTQYDKQSGFYIFFEKWHEILAFLAPEQN